MTGELVCLASDHGWRAARQAGVTATDIGIIAGLSPHGSEYSLHLQKRGMIPEPDRDGDDRLRLGHVLQPYVLRRWQETADNAPLHAQDTLWRSTDRPWQMATVDALTIGNRPVEVKTWADADRWHWDAGPPARVRVQALWQADTLGVGLAYVAVLFLPSGEFRGYVVSVESPEIDRLRKAGLAFLQGIRLKQVPSLDGSLATIAALKSLYRVPELTSFEVSRNDWLAFTQNRRNAKAYEDEARKAEARLRDQIGAARRIMVGGEQVGTHVMGKRDYIKIRGNHGD